MKIQIKREKWNIIQSFNYAEHGEDISDIKEIFWHSELFSNYAIADGIFNLLYQD